MRRRIAVFIIGGTAVGFALTGQAHAQSVNDRFWVQGAAYWAEIDTKARVTSIGATQTGTEIDFESDLALDDNQTLPSVSAGWRVSPRFIIGADYYGLDREASVGIGRDLVFDDVVFPVSAAVSTKMATDIYRLTLGYSFIRRPDFEAGAALGLHATDVDISLQGEARLGNNTVETTIRQKQFLAPLPTVGLYANWDAAPKVTVNGRVDYMSLSYGDYDGAVLNAQIQASYRFHRNVGIGAMYRFVDYDVGVEKPDWTGEVDYEFSGPSLYLEIAF